MITKLKRQLKELNKTISKIILDLDDDKELNIILEVVSAYREISGTTLTNELLSMRKTHLWNSGINKTRQMIQKAVEYGLITKMVLPHNRFVYKVKEKLNV